MKMENKKMTDETGNNVAVFGNNVEIADSDQLLKDLQGTEDEGGHGGDTSFMSFSGKKGTYKIGTNGRAPDADEPFLVNAGGFELGWMCWKGGKPVAKRMANVKHPKMPDPDMEENGPFNPKAGEGWSKARAISLRSFENGEECYFTTSSKTGVSAFSNLHKLVVERLKSGQAPWPVVNFSMKEIKLGDFMVPIPVIDVVKWLANEDMQFLSNPDNNPMDLMKEDNTPAPTPVKRRL